MAERFVKYCKEKVTTRMEALRTERWTPLLEDVVLQYNTTRKQSSTGLTPMTAEKYPSRSDGQNTRKKISAEKILQN